MYNNVFLAEVKLQKHLRQYISISLLCLLLIASGCGNAHKAKKKRKKKKAKTEQVSKAKPPVKTVKPEEKRPAATGKNAQAEKVLTAAKSYLGTPYKYGGTTKSGMDCSGFVLTSFRAAGIELPRTSKDQSMQGKAVDKKDVIPGDLVFFSRSFNKEVGHAGIVVEAGTGSAKFIHASTSKGVRIDDLYGEYWSKLFLKARRVL
jgi:cell wall-associated NlpC family hydrolase